MAEIEGYTRDIEIINNTRGGIEGEIGERVYWGANLEPGNYNCKLHIHMF